MKELINKEDSTLANAQFRALLGDEVQSSQSTRPLELKVGAQSHQTTRSTHTHELDTREN
jgi:hypothetical protein